MDAVLRLEEAKRTNAGGAGESQLMTFGHTAAPGHDGLYPGEAAWVPYVGLERSGNSAHLGPDRHRGAYDKLED